MGCKMKENYYALLIAIFKDCLADEAFQLLDTGNCGYKYKRSADDSAKIEEMIELKNQGYTYQRIGDIYGIARNTVCEKISRYKKRMAIA